MKLTICHLYPDLMNLYGDKGNIQCILKRCKWRNIQSKLILYKFNNNNKINFSNIDIILLGGGSDKNQILVAYKLYKIKNDLKRYIENNGVMIAICGGYQLLGNYYKINKNKIINGLSIFNFYTVKQKTRLISNTIIKNNNFKLPIVGFENHAGRTYINNNAIFGNVIHGYGNNGYDQTEGILYKNTIGTYLHGPLLPKNPHICDYLIIKALQQKYNKVNLKLLNDIQEIKANQYIYNKYINKNRG